MTRSPSWLASPALALAVVATGGHASPVVWPPLPTAAVLARANSMKSPSGLVVVERTSVVKLRSFEAEPTGSVREEYVRYLVQSEEAAARATIDIEADDGSSITRIEGRTISPDGTVTPLDQERDVKKVDVTAGGKRRRKATTALATVKFPAVTRGALLDLSYTTSAKDPMVFHVQPLVQERIPVVSALFETSVTGGFPGVPWAAMTVNDTAGAVRLESGPSGSMVVRVADFIPLAEEPLSPPDHHLHPMFLLFMDFSALRLTGPPSGKIFMAPFEVDARGRVTSITYPDPRHYQYWAKYLQEEERSGRRFLGSPGAAAKIDVAGLAPPTLPLEERVAALYRASQEAFQYNPDATDVTSLSAMLKRGTPSTDHGTLLLSYLLGRAGIEHRLGMVANRYALRFAPIFRNELLFGFERIVLVPLPDGRRLFLMPGYKDLPPGSLPVSFQESVVLLPRGGEGVDDTFTPAENLQNDRMEFTFDLALDGQGDAEGKLTLRQSGAPAQELAMWVRLRAHQARSPKGAKGKESEAAVREREKRLDEFLKEELRPPGNLLTIHEVSPPEEPRSAAEALTISASVTARGLAQPVQDAWLLFPYAAAAGYTSPFTERRRALPVWYAKSGKLVMTGEIRLPPGATVKELPSAAALRGPDGLAASGSVQAVEVDGRITLRSQLEIDQPSIVGSDVYESWRRFQAAVQALSQERCIVTLPANKVLE